MKKIDNVNHPPHYNQQNIECIDAIQCATGDGFENYLQGNIIKYIWRYNYKNGTEIQVETTGVGIQFHDHFFFGRH